MTRGLRVWSLIVTGLTSTSTLAADAPAPFHYQDAKIAYYPPGGTTKGDGAWNKMQLPLAAAESSKHMRAPDGFEVRLYAAEPDVVKPVAMSWDERGRLWVVESTDYPNDIAPSGPGHDRIKICEDLDGDGRADKFTIFADGLSGPTGISFARGGVIVMMAPKTLFLKDTDADDRADVREVLFEGWGTADTHAGPSNLHYGFDNWIWGMVGYSGFDGRVGGEAHKFYNVIYRFKADGSKLEVIRSVNNNTWGLGFSEDALVFVSTANCNPSGYMPIPNRYYERVRGWSVATLGPATETPAFRPITEKVRQVDCHGGFTAAAGHAIYTARTYPDTYWNRTAFVAEPTGHLVGTFVLDRAGADFRSRNTFNLVASDDEWTAPIMAEVGPDGNVWVIDWYSYIVQHNPTPAGFKTGRGLAYVTDLRDKTHGRIYRVVHANGARPAPTASLAGASPARLVATLAADNLLWRRHAQRLLVERGKADVVRALLRLLHDRKADAVGLNAGALHALWTLQGLGLLDAGDKRALAAAEGALQHPSAAVRRAALMALPGTARTVAALLRGRLTQDGDAQVRLAALLALSDAPADRAAAEAVVSTLKQSANADDKWIADAATSAGARNGSSFLAAAVKGNGTGASGAPIQGAAEVVARIARHQAAIASVDSLALLRPLRDADPRIAKAVLGGLAEGWPAARAPRLTPDDERALVGLLDALPPAGRDDLLVLADRWGRRDLVAHALAQAVAVMRKTIEDDAQPIEARVESAVRLIRLHDAPDAVDTVVGQVTPRVSPDLGAGLVKALRRSRQDDVATKVIARWDALTPGLRRAGLSVLVEQPAWTGRLLDAVQKKEIGRADIPAEYWQQLKRHPDRRLANRARELDVARGNPDRRVVYQQLLRGLDRPGNAARGGQLFGQLCLQCHRLEGQGGQVGPELTGIGIRAAPEVLAEIVDPNRSVEANFRMWTVETDDGQVVDGRLDGESKSSVDILDLTGQRHSVQRAGIKKLVVSPDSLMPVGLIDHLQADDVAALMSYLMASKRPRQKN